MGVGTSLILIAIGAILEYAFHPANSHGFDINTIGLILMVVGGIGLLVSLLFWNSWGGFGGRGRVVGVGTGDRPHPEPIGRHPRQKRRHQRPQVAEHVLRRHHLTPRRLRRPPFQQSRRCGEARPCSPRLGLGSPRQTARSRRAGPG